MKKSLLLVLLATLGLSGCVVAPAYDGPYGYYPAPAFGATVVVRPGYYAVVMGGNANQDVLLSAYKGPAGEVVVVAVNKTAAEVSIPITIVGGTAPAMLTPTVTSASQNLIDGTPVAVTGGVFTATLPATSVTTFH